MTEQEFVEKMSLETRFSLGQVEELLLETKRFAARSGATLPDALVAIYAVAMNVTDFYMLRAMVEMA